jgi:hypothetical protein
MSCKKCNTTKCTCEASICISPLIYMMKSVFALEGTLSSNFNIKNDLIDISNKCLDPVIPVQCDDYILNLPEALYKILNSGITISNNKDYCCPDCKNGVYFLGSPEVFIELKDFLVDDTKICCIEHYTTADAWIRYLKDLNIKCCNTDFSETINNWINASSTTSNYFYLDALTELGLVESSSFNSYSGLGILFDFLQLNFPELTSEDYLNVLGVIMNLGVVIECNGCEMFISSVTTYKLINA